ncbi:MAG: glycoside hydrolase family 3 N-terminal domain-containing protein [Clostridiales bacterium]|nr:glycoside hydrolase family 3 N-terminal domain-containing protein [Clostridiales bacterium]
MDENKLQKLLQEMTLQEKIEQLVQLDSSFFDNDGVCTGPVEKFAMTEEQPYRVGSLLGVRGAAKIIDLQDRMMALQPHHIPALFMLDVIHGYQTIFPVPIAIGSSFNPELAEQVTAVAAREASAAGVQVTFSPMIDLVRDSRWGRCMEATGEDPWLNARMAEHMVRGFQGDNMARKGKMASCIKHFAAYGAVQAGRDYNVTELSEHTLLEDYLVSYRAAVKAGAAMVMTAFNTIDRKPCTTNRRLLRDILREDMGFDGVVISDFSALRETIVFGTSRDHADAARQGIVAGCDIEMMSECYLHHLEELIRTGEVSETMVDEAVMRILRLKNALGLFENPYKDASVEDEKRLIFCEEHQALSRSVAEECIVLLKNDGLLPLSDKQKIVVAGALAQDREITGSWALFADWNQTITMRKGIETLYPQADVTFFPSDNVTEDMLAAARTADVVILALGENQRSTGESQSKADISLSKEHTAMFEAVYAVNPRIVTVLFGGRPLAVPELAAKTSALVEAWLPGSCGCYALADILFGRVNPSGRLSMSMPYCTGQLPISYGANLTGRPKPEKDGFFAFTSNYLDAPNEPLYPFGYGLSYGEVSYSPVTLDSYILQKDGQITACVTMENRCELPVKEAVQLYLRDMHGSVIRPERELKGLQKVSLQPGESRQVTFVITEDMLRFYDADMHYVSEPGAFRLWIGHDSLTENSVDFILA